MCRYEESFNEILTFIGLRRNCKVERYAWYMDVAEKDIVEPEVRKT